MVFIDVLVAAALLGLLLGGRLSGLRDLRLRAPWLFYAAIALQVVAFPSGILPWGMNDVAARVLWLVSFGFLGAGAYANRRTIGVPVVALGMLLNVVAVSANGGHMPVRPQALAASGAAYHVHNNSIYLTHPHLSWLIDRWAAPAWVPLGNVYSVGDVLIALGAVVVVVAAMRPRLLRRLIPARNATA